MKHIKIAKWSKFQHYKDRRPTWIKLLVEIVKKYDAAGNRKKFYQMPDSAKLTFILLACLRAEFDEHIPYESNGELKTMLGISKLNLQPLIDNGFIVIDTVLVRKCYEKNTPETYKEETYKEETETEMFDIARKIFKGTVLGNETEFANFKKKTTDWKTALPLLRPAIEKEIVWRKTAKKGEFRPAWKNFQTWINKRCWEQILAIDETVVKKDRCHYCGATDVPLKEITVIGKTILCKVCQVCYEARKNNSK